ncbi:hypothetical protein GRJ2_000421700 [Grus japonensis]|uniref:Dtw domain-containing protein 2 n=1 Tax=Grus japonensis TaxID=30415 RepID=A0ABC9W1S8_GRUJA
MDVATQTELLQKHAATQVSGCRECQSLSLGMDGSEENGCVRCDQVDDLLSLVAELREKVPLYNMFEALDMEGQSMEDMDDSPSTPEVLPRSERPTPCIMTTSTRKKSHPDICWRDNAAGHKQSRKFLECIDDNFLLQVIEESTRRGAMLDLVLTNKEGLVGNVKLNGSLGCSDHEIVEFNILRATRRVHSKLAALDFRRVDWPLQGPTL